MTDQENFDDLFEDEAPSQPKADVKNPHLTNENVKLLKDLELELSEDPLVLEKAAALRESVPATVLLGAYFMAQTGTFDCPLFGPNATIADLFQMSTVIAPLKGGLPSTKPLNLQQPVDLAKSRVLAQEQLQTILHLSLTDVKPKTVQFMTPSALCTFAYDLPGSVSTIVVENNEVVGWDITVPSMPKIRATDQDGIAVVREGGYEFVNSYNRTYGCAMQYLDLNRCQMKVVLFLLSRYKLSYDNQSKVFRLVPIVTTDPLKLGVDICTPREQLWAQKVATTFNEMIHTRKLIIPSGMPASSNPRFVMEFAVYEMCKNSNFNMLLVKMEHHLDERANRIHVAIGVLLSSVSDLNTALPKFMPVKATEGGKSSSADFRNFRDACNSNYRANHKGTDLKKEDSLDLSGFAKSKSSVTYKTMMGIEWLKKMGALSGACDAFGVGKTNNWQRAIESSFPLVEFYDNDADKVGPLKLGGNCKLGDTTNLEPNSGIGKTICDDSCPEDPLKKLESIMKAQYDSGFVKMMMGWGSDAEFGPSVLPPALREFAKAHAFVDFYRVSPHSEEYFIVFVKDLKGKYPAVPQGKGSWSDAMTDLNAGDFDEASWCLRARKWRYARCLEIYAANVARSVTTISGIGRAKLPAIYNGMRGPVRPTTLVGSGLGTAMNVKGGVNAAKVHKGDLEF